MGKRANGEGSIYRRNSDGKWVGSLTLPEGKRNVTYHATQKEALDWLSKSKADLAKGILLPSDRTTVGQFLRQWHEEVVRPHRSPATYILRDNHIRLHLSELDRIVLSKLSSQRIQALVNNFQKKGLSPKSIQAIIGTLNVALKQAIAWDLIHTNPIRGLSIPRVESVERKTLTLEESSRFLEALADHVHGPIFATLLMVGLRRGEVLGLWWSDLDLDRGVMKITGNLQCIVVQEMVEGKTVNRYVLDRRQPKTIKGRRTIHLPEPLVLILRAHRARQGEMKLRAGIKWVEDSYMFGHVDGSPRHPRVLNKAFPRFLKKHGFDPMRLHDLRHTCGTLLSEAKVDIKSIQEILGHEDIQTTMNIYVSHTEQRSKDTAEALTRIFG